MDCLAVDITGADELGWHEGMPLDLIGPDRPLAAVARAAGTIGYEFLTSLGSRYRRTYLPAGTS